MPRMTKAEEARISSIKRENKMLKENPPWSETNKNTEFYHIHEYKALTDIRETLDTLVQTLEEQRTHYTLSAVIIPESLLQQLQDVADAIYDEQMTRDAAGRPTETSFIALQNPSSLPKADQ